MPDYYDRLLHRAAVLTAGLTFLLIIAGGLVTSRDAGLAVPDWPLSFGSINPPHWYAIENVRTEHGHRLIAGIVTLATLTTAIIAKRRDPRRWARRLAAAAAGAVLLQALLGGIRVLSLDIDFAIVHGAVGQAFFCLTVLLAAATSPVWADLQQDNGRRPHLRRWATLLAVAVFGQLLVGLSIRHIVSAGQQSLLAAPIFYTHIGLGLAVALLAVLTLLAANAEGTSGAAARLLRRPASAVTGLVVVQIGLGFATFIITDAMTPDRQATMLEGWLPTLHVAVGAAILATSVLLSVRCFVGGLAEPAALANPVVTAR